MNKKPFLFIFFFIFFMMNLLRVESLEYDYSSTVSVPIRLSISEELTTKGGIIEGREIELFVINDVYYNNKLIVKKDSIAKAKVETTLTRGMNGFPAEIVLGSFEFEEIPDSKIIASYLKKGANRCFWVYPIKWALTPIPGAGSLTNFILGGEAKITQKDKIVVYYYPEWK